MAINDSKIDLLSLALRDKRPTEDELIASIVRLVREVDRLRDDLHELTDDYGDLQGELSNRSIDLLPEVDLLNSENSRLRMALESVMKRALHRGVVDADGIFIDECSHNCWCWEIKELLDV